MEARGREEFENYLPRSMFEWMVARNELVGVNGGGGIRVAGGVAEGGLGVVERRAHEDHESVRMLLG